MNNNILGVPNKVWIKKLFKKKGNNTNLTDKDIRDYSDEKEELFKKVFFNLLNIDLISIIELRFQGFL